jgi:DNA-binding NarL/FixJ family response regulator
MDLHDLTGRRREIAELMATGLSRSQIAACLKSSSGVPISVRTVDTHIRRIADALPHDHVPAFRRVQLWVRSQK